MLEPGLDIGSYKLLRPLGAGGMGSVWEAADKNGQVWAIKFCALPDQEARLRFDREVRAMSALTHVNVVRIVFADTAADPPYFVMPYSELGVQEACSNLDETDRLKLFLQVCAGVRALHSAGVIHRDIKPDNMRMFGEHAAVSDLGLARFVLRDSVVLTQTRIVLGTEWYLAPEQRAPGGSRDADERTDVYQLGRSLYQLLTGDPPVLMDVTKFAPHLRLIVDGATREHPNDRYQSVAQLMDVIEIYLAAKSPTISPHDALSACISSIKDQARYGRYDPEEVKKAVALLLIPDVLEDRESWLVFFDDIPSSILSVLPSVLGERELTTLFEEYKNTIIRTVRGKRFEYAETVASKVALVLAAPSPKPLVVAHLLESALVAAVGLNRFSAMDRFNDLLRAVKDDGVAMVVAEMLAKRPEYLVVADQVPRYQLNPVIAALRRS